MRIPLYDLSNDEQKEIFIEKMKNDDLNSIKDLPENMILDLSKVDCCLEAEWILHTDCVPNTNH